MKKIIPFKKQIYFKNNVGEITSISLENTLMPVSENLIKGDFIISGEYKMTDTSTHTDPFEFNVPCDIELQDNYKLDNVQINIDDFYYEIIDSKILEVNIDVLLDRLEEKELINQIPIKYTSIEELKTDLQDTVIDNNVDTIKESDLNTNQYIEENIKEVDNMKEEIKIEENRCVEKEEYGKSIFSNFNNTEEEYRTYRVYIVREGDSLEQIISKYQITKDELEKYNDLKEITIGDKIIIPYYEDNQ